MENARVAFARIPGEQAETEENLESAVDVALRLLGGIEKFIGRGDKVLLKPNQTLFMPERSGSTTSPRLIRTLVRMAFEAGAREVWVAEASGHAQRSRTVMTNSGMVHGVSDTKAHLIYLDEIAEKVVDYGPEAGAVRYMPIPEIFERADAIINVPKAKTHFVDPVSIACKNWIGVMPMSFRLWAQREVEPYYQGNAWNLKKFRPTLNVVDGAWAGEGQGPGGNDPFWWGWIVASEDPVATDVTIARLFGLDHAAIRMANEAAKIGVGTNNPDRIEILGATFEEAVRPVKPANPDIHRFPCNVIAGKRGATMEGTLGHWKTIADGWEGVGLWKLFTLFGTPTFLFGDAEDPDFEKHLEEGPYIVLDDAALDKYKYDERVCFVPGSPVPQSYMQNEMIEGMGFAGIYQLGLSLDKMLEHAKGVLQSKG
jgi:uncharacterized protein (DUF362 family)